jgi:nitrite reductase/ring-hydroxylating ferredoxin subunit
MKSVCPKLFLFFLIINFILPESCNDNIIDGVPYVPVDIVLDLQADLSYVGVGETAILIPDPEGFGVLSFSSSKYAPITLGQFIQGNGLIIYRQAVDEFAVYDITCTYKASTDFCALEMDDTWLIPKCPCCGSEFNILLEGSPVSGPAAVSLKQYSCFIRNNQLYIKN